MRRRLFTNDLGLRHDAAENVADHRLVSSRNGNDPFGIAMFGNRKRKGAAAKLGAIGLLVQALENQPDLISRGRLRFQSVLKGANDPFVAILKIRGDEMIF